MILGAGVDALWAHRWRHREAGHAGSRSWRHLRDDADRYRRRGPRRIPRARDGLVQPGEPAGFFMATLGAILLLFIYRKAFRAA